MSSLPPISNVAKTKSYLGSRQRPFLIKCIEQTFTDEQEEHGLFDIPSTKKEWNKLHEVTRSKIVLSIKGKFLTLNHSNSNASRKKFNAEKSEDLVTSDKIGDLLKDCFKSTTPASSVSIELPSLSSNTNFNSSSEFTPGETNEIGVQSIHQVVDF